MRRIWDFLRSLMIFFATACPPCVGMVATKICNWLPSYLDEEGGFRTDVAVCALGILRNGGVKQFEFWIGRYPFEERWQGLFHPRMWRVRFVDGSGWHILNITHCVRQYGRAVILPTTK